MESFLLEFISPGLNLMAFVSLVVGTTAIVCRALKWAPFNVTVNITTNNHDEEKTHS